MGTFFNDESSWSQHIRVHRISQRLNGAVLREDSSGPGNLLKPLSEKPETILNGPMAINMEQKMAKRTRRKHSATFKTKVFRLKVLM
jgi:hypothetical protein